MNVLGMIMYILNMLNLTEKDRKLTSFFTAFYYFAQVFGYLENEVSMNKPMHEKNAEVDIGNLNAELMQHYEEERFGHMHG